MFNSEYLYMKKKIVSVFIGIAIISGSLIGGIYLFIWIDDNQTSVKITVLWDEPKDIDSYNYNKSTTEPNYVEIYTLPEQKRDHYFDHEINFERNISLIKKNEGIFSGKAKISFQTNLIYLIKVPEIINNLNIIDNLTIIEIDKTKKFNDLTIHFWKNLYLVRKPAIYLYNTEYVQFTETLSVSIPNGCVTKTIPEITLGQNVKWENFEVYPESQILFKGNFYPYLFYEAMIETLDILTFECGWVFQNYGNTWEVNGDLISNLELFFEDSLLDLGLYENEIFDFIEYWFEEHPIFSEEGTYILRQIPLNIINYNFQLETTHSYSTNRMFFTFFYYPEILNVPNLLSPEPMISNIDSNYILHEWGIIF